MSQQQLARGGQALFKVRGKYLIRVIIIGAAIAWFQGSSVPFASTVANPAWCSACLGVASAGALASITPDGIA